MPENPTLAQYDAQHAGADVAAEPTPDPRVVALQKLVDAEQEKGQADAVYSQASRRRAKAVAALDEAKKAAREAVEASLR